MTNRKERRKQAAQARRKTDDPSEPFEARLQAALHEAIARVVPPSTLPEAVPHAEIIRGLGLIAAAFAVQSGVDRASFSEAMGAYHHGIASALGAQEEPHGPTLEIP